MLWHQELLGLLDSFNCPRWVSAKDGLVPSNAIIGGQEPSWPLYVCRAHVMADILPGKLIPQSVCDLAYDNRELSLRDYEVLTGSCPMHWENVADATTPAIAVQGGTESGKPVSICRATITVGTGGVHIGRTGLSTANKCLISYGGRAYSYETFEVLTMGKQ